MDVPMINELRLPEVIKGNCAYTLLLPPIEIHTHQQPSAFVTKPNYVCFLIVLSSNMTKHYITKGSYFPVKTSQFWKNSKVNTKTRNTIVCQIKRG